MTLTAQEVVLACLVKGMGEHYTHLADKIITALHDADYLENTNG